MAPLTNYAAAINELAEECSAATESKGFLDNDLGSDFAQVVAKIALIGTEVSEALAVHRDFYDDDDEDVTTRMTPLQESDLTEEVADIVIRCLDLCGYLDLDLGNAILDKMAKNRERVPKHGKRY
jgi:NTP pyrophosphatase (non-canonical NTP hydrolase)